MKEESKPRCPDGGCNDVSFMGNILLEMSHNIEHHKLRLDAGADKMKRINRFQYVIIALSILGLIIELLKGVVNGVL
jgi:hypothetical protein